MNELKWELKQFDEFSASVLYKILKLRSEIFVIEQNCVYLDLDDKDQESFHLYSVQNEAIIAYARILPPGLSYPEASIGRVLTNPAYRKNGAGKILMQKAIEDTYTLFGNDSIKIGAQLYLLSFYTSLGFKQISDPYPEDGILHIEMLHSK